MKKPTKRFRVIMAICSICTLAVLALTWHGCVPLEDAEFYTQDLRAQLGRKTPMNSRLVLIGIDRPQYAPSDFSEDDQQKVPAIRHLFEAYPWSREVWAELVSRLAEAGAKVIVLDIIFAANREDDTRFKEVIDKYRDRVVIGYDLINSKAERGNSISLQLPSESVISYPPDAHPIEDFRLGFVTVWPDRDNIVRRASYRQDGDEIGNVVASDIVIESLEARALRHLGHPELIPARFHTTMFRYTGPPGTGFEHHPVGDVLSPKLWERNYGNGMFFKDKIVLIGPMAEIFHDVHNTPMKPLDQGEDRTLQFKAMPGPELHLNILNAALHGEFLREASRYATLAIIALSGILAAALGFRVRQPVKLLGLVVIIGVGYWVLAQTLFSHQGLVIPVAVPLLVLITCSVVMLSYDFLLEQLERIKLRHTMSLYFSPRVLEVVLANPGSMEPRRAEVTMLLTDLRNSTPLAELLGPQGTFELLNRVFEAQTSAIMGEEGNLEHFLGDQFLSYWGAPQPQTDAADRARRAATKLITAMEALRGALPEPVAKLFGYGVALHSGKVLVGNKGSAMRLDYGLVGDAVNEAARIEALTKYYGVRMLVSRETFRQFTDQGAHRLIDRVIVKGKTEPVELFECENPCTSAVYSELCKGYEAAYAEYERGNFGKAQGDFEKLVKDFNDGASRALAARCVQLVASPPADWKGVWKMESK